MSVPTNFDIISIGELLIDMVSSDYAEDLSQADTFHRMPGGSPANMAGNLVRLGKKVALVASVGTDEAGRYLCHHVEKLGLDVSRVRQVVQPTTLILVTKSRAVSSFEAYRSADTAIALEQTDIDWICQARVMHTTAFALSREPARTSILTAADQACYAGVQASIDANYATKIWPDRLEALGVISRYLAHGALAKFSEVDFERLFAEPVEDPVKAGERIRDLGAKLVCLTMGRKRCLCGQ